VFPNIAKLIAAVLFCSSIFRGATSWADESPQIAEKPAKTGRLIYRKSPRRTMTVYYPDDWKATDQRPALVIFRCNIPAQREHFRKLGMVILKPQLAAVNSGRLPSLTLDEIAEQPKPREQVQDVKSSIRYIRSHASELGIHPDQIVATGTSGGGDLALQGYLNTAFEDPGDDPAVSHKPNALILYCPAFDGIDIWFVKSQVLLDRAKTDAPSFLPLLSQFANTKDEYALPLDHRKKLIDLAATIGKKKEIDKEEIERFQAVLTLFNERDWQLLHPVADARQMSASRILGDAPLPPTLIMYGKRDHLFEHQQAFVEHAKKLGKEFTLKVYEGAGHSFMMQPYFIKPSTADAEAFLKKWKYLPVKRVKTQSEE